MKTISEMAIECGCTYRDVYEVIRKFNIQPITYLNKGRKRVYHQTQVNLIYKILYFELKCDVIIIESKMNKVESKEEQYEQFREFKKKTYGI